ncbi:MAG: right-handed parallel beta-helix repeat-containing protein [Parvibaculaceae bacterium]|nr:right-handed parallel beta-helix repeat-containing protein [Parvibaculaceae bacterium]
MAIQQINIGTAANDGTGDPLRNAWDKANQNFDELDTRASTAQDTAEDALADAVSSVKSVNGKSPDSDGGVHLEAVDVSGSVLTVNSKEPDSSGDILLTGDDVSGAVLTVNGSEPDSTGEVILNAIDIPGAALSVNGQDADSTGDVSVDGRNIARHNRVVEQILSEASNSIHTTDEGKTLIANRATAISFDLDPMSTFSDGARIRVINRGQGELTIAVGDSADDIESEATLSLSTDESADLWKGNGPGWSAQVFSAGGDAAFTVTGGTQARTLSDYELLNAVFDFGIDNSGSTDVSSAMQAAINSASAAGKTLYLPAGIYDFGGTGVDLNGTGFRMIGDGPATILRKSVNNLTECVRLGANNIILENFLVKYPLSAYQSNNGHCAIKYDSRTGIQASNINVEGRFYLGHYLLNAKDTLLRDSDVYGAVNRSFYVASDVPSGVSIVRLRNCYSSCYDFGTSTKFTDYGFNTNCFGTGTGFDVVFSECKTVGFTDHGFSASERMSDVKFRDCEASNGGTGADGFLFQLANGYNNQYASAVNCRALACGGHGFYVNESLDAQLSNCHARFCTGDGFRFNNSRFVNVSGCHSIANSGDGFRYVASSAAATQYIIHASTISRLNTGWGYRADANAHNLTFGSAAGNSNTAGDYDVSTTGSFLAAAIT